MLNKIILVIITIALLILGKFAFNYLQYGSNTQNEQKIQSKATELRTDIKVILYSRIGCSYCNLAKNLLEEMRIPYETIELTENTDLREKLIKQTGQYTVPYIFINDKFIGGYQNLLNMKEEGKI